MNVAEKNIKTDYDLVLSQIADYVLEPLNPSEEAWDTARLCLLDALGCGIKALDFPACRRLLGPIVPGATLKGGARVPGTSYELDPVQAAFNIGMLVRWLDFNDTWLAFEWGHPSDNLGAILAIADYISRQQILENKPGLLMKDVLIAMIKAYEIQGVLALKNSFNRVGLDHVILVKLASAAVTANLLGANREMTLRILSQVFVDGQSLRTYRHAPNAGSRKSWAAGDATSRAVFLSLLCEKGEMGYPSALTAPRWGFYDVLFEKKPFVLERPFGNYVMENVLFKLSYPAEFHAQTAVECAVLLHPHVKDSLDAIERIELVTHESAIRIISKEGPLYNPADRDHCLQYMVAVGLLFGTLNAEHYEDGIASLPEIDKLREKMTVRENLQFSADYLEPSKRSIANTVRIIFKDNRTPLEETIEYPIGHRFRREEGRPVLFNKFQNNLKNHFSEIEIAGILKTVESLDAFSRMPVVNFMKMWQREG